MNREKDQLFVISIVEESYYYPTNAVSAQIYIDANRNYESKTRALLSFYAKKCRDAGIHHFSTIIGHGYHIGEVICEAVEKKGIDYLIIGRNAKMGIFARLLVGSTSKYCMEHASCNVIVVKNPTEAEKVHLQLPAHVISEEATTAPISEHVTDHDVFLHKPQRDVLSMNESIGTATK
eukprot:TRINITY_DN1755_c0_g1_i10.p1 TRINITY_DN1755_c0_g1~~TRINITY_DN1755_c0_g1_i10.p1  ORF type:complete len:178 (-),score=29.50 TRINITY_DN1755_c0_g1_i10:254-787(-)